MLQGSEQASLAGELGFALQFTDFSSYLQSFPSISVTSYEADCPPTIILHDMRCGEKKGTILYVLLFRARDISSLFGSSLFCDRTSPKYLPQLPNG